MGLRGIATVAALLLGGVASAGSGQVAAGGRQLIRLDAGQSTTLYGATYRAEAATLAVAVLSSELVTVAVAEGALAGGGERARAGEALVVPVDGGRTRRFGFDARRLAATLPPAMARAVTAPLERIAARQRRQRLWGRIVPVRVNAAAPVAGGLEPVRASYLSNPTVAALRREGAGEPAKLALLTARRFAAALAARDAGTVADLLDPKPFTDTGADAASWQAARLAFATRLTGDGTVVSAMAGPPAAVAADTTAFDTGGYRIRLVPRDRAMFVTAVEKL